MTSSASEARLELGYNKYTDPSGPSPLTEELSQAGATVGTRWSGTQASVDVLTAHMPCQPAIEGGCAAEILVGVVAKLYPELQGQENRFIVRCPGCQKGNIWPALTASEPVTTV